MTFDDLRVFVVAWVQSGTLLELCERTSMDRRRIELGWVFTKEWRHAETDAVR